MTRAATPIATAFLALVLAAGTAAPAAAADYVYRARPVAITAPAPSLPAGAIQSGPDVLLAAPTPAADGSTLSEAGSLYRALAPLSQIVARIKLEKPSTLLSVNNQPDPLCYVPTSAVPDCLKRSIATGGVYGTVDAWERDGWLYYRAQSPFRWTPADNAERAFFARFDFRQVAPR